MSKAYKRMAKRLVVYGIETWPGTELDMRRLNDGEESIKEDVRTSVSTRNVENKI